ncbi:MAG: Lrp/AsnC family transcriptional regulator [Bacillota bacterium]
MDKLDRLILSELLKDATQSFLKIAKELDTSPYTVRRRYEKLKQNGIIHNCIVSIDLSKIGYQGKAFLFITVGPEANKSEIISQLKKIKNIIVVTKLIGPYEILAIAPITDLKSVQTLVKEIRKIPNIQQIKTACIYDTQFPIGGNFGKQLSEAKQNLTIS